MTPLRPLSRDEVRDVDRLAIEQYGLPGIVLMENAGRGAAELLQSLGIHGSVVVCAGAGNNGGDGFVIARHLDLAGHAVRVLLFARPDALRGDAAVNHRVVERAGIPIHVMEDDPAPADIDRELKNAAWVVDALLGTGVRGAVRSPFDAIIDGINAAGRPVLAVDLPSGMDCDTGDPLGVCVRADHTVTFVARKKGFDAPGAARWTGAVHIVEIGAPRRLLDMFRSNGESRP
ncbi:MAG: NAD(P)H-hydrate epimerase [Planctomycetaceae bacterium]